MSKKNLNKVTPMMQQYIRLKEEYPDCLLMFRLGDFYELFFDDALTASRELEIVLTGRNCGLEERAPMCGVPYHSASSYIDRLVAKGYKVAVCEQLEDPKLAKGLVDRGIVRIITPGTLTDTAALDEKANNYIMALAEGPGGTLGFAVADVSTGEFSIGELEAKKRLQKLSEELARVVPTELIVADGLKDPALLRALQGKAYLSRYPDWAFEPETAKKNLLSHFHLKDLAGYGCEDMEAAVCAAGGLLAYLNETQKNALEHISSIRVYHRSSYMMLDETTRRNLELTQSLREGKQSKKSTLLGLLDRTKTAMGGRLLRSWIAQPLIDKAAIERRLSCVKALSGNVILRGELSAELDQIYDLERICSKIAYGSLNARDALSLKNSLAALPALCQSLSNTKNPGLQALSGSIDLLEDVRKILEEAIAEDPPAVITEGGIIKNGYNAEVDRLRTAATNGRQWVVELEQKEREQTGIKNLKISYNKVFGYYIEVTRSYFSQVPARYERRQTLANAERFITPELKELEETILGAQERLVALEYQVFSALRELLCAQIARIQKTSAAVAAADCLNSLAEVADTQHYCQPVITEKDEIVIKNGRHPVVERTSSGFVPNDTLLDCRKNRLLIITGPNMAGKSTYMRQVALIVLMAHMGSFVPADEATIAITDRIFTRVGASDDLAGGQSTFMVEMSETANILNNATSRSLLLLDEIGRGTSTFDGLSIAWAVVEYIANKQKIGAKTLFATHYHELSELEGLLDGVVNYRITAREMGEEIIFLRKVVRGGSDKSYGIQVARLAGIPRPVIDRAKEILKKLEANQTNRAVESETNTQLSALQESPPIVRELAALKVDNITPFEAIGLLYDLKERAQAAIAPAGEGKK